MTRTDKSTVKRLLRIDWDTVGRIIARVSADELDPDRLNELYDIGIDEVSWKRQHNYLTLVADHRRGKIVWGCEGAGEKAADFFFAELDPEIATGSPPHEPPESSHNRPSRPTTSRLERSPSRGSATALGSSRRSRSTWVMGTPLPPASMPRRR